MGLKLSGLSHLAAPGPAKETRNKQSTMSRNFVASLATWKDAVAKNLAWKDNNKQKKTEKQNIQGRELNSHLPWQAWKARSFGTELIPDTCNNLTGPYDANFNCFPLASLVVWGKNLQVQVCKSRIGPWPYIKRDPGAHMPWDSQPWAQIRDGTYHNFDCRFRREPGARSNIRLSSHCMMLDSTNDAGTKTHMDDPL